MLFFISNSIFLNLSLPQSSSRHFDNAIKLRVRPYKYILFWKKHYIEVCQEHGLIKTYSCRKPAGKRAKGTGPVGGQKLIRADGGKICLPVQKLGNKHEFLHASNQKCGVGIMHLEVTAAQNGKALNFVGW